MNLDWSPPDNRVTLLNLLHETEKHGLLIKASVVAEAVLIQIGLQVAFTNRMINAAQPVLKETPKAFDRICVNVANNIDLGTVVDSFVVVETIRHVRDAVVGAELVREDCGLWENVFMDHTEKRRALHIIGNERFNVALAFNDANNRSLGFIAAHRSATPTLALAANIGFIHLNGLAFAADRIAVLLQHCANLLEHAPRRLVRHSRFSLNLLRRNPAARLSHQVDRIEPRRKWRGRLVEDCPGGWVNVVAA